MKKKIFTLSLIFTLAMSLCSCDKSDNTTTKESITEATMLDASEEKPSTTEETTEVASATTETKTTESTTEEIAQVTTEATTQPPATTSTPTTTATPITTAEPKCNHNWVEQTKTVHHEAVGHMDTKYTWIDANGNDYGDLTQWTIVDGKRCIQVGSDPYYICNACGTRFYLSAYGGESGAGAASREHTVNTGHGSSSAYADPIYVEVFYKEIAVFVEDKPAWDEEVVTGYTCSYCGATK